MHLTYLTYFLPVENRAVNKSSPFCPSLCYSACLCLGVKSEFFPFSFHSSFPRFFWSSSLTFSFWSPRESYPCMLGFVHQYVPYQFPSPLLSRYALFEASISSEQPDLCLSSNLWAILDDTQFVAGRSCMTQSPSYIFCCATFGVNSASEIYKAIDILYLLSCSSGTCK